MPFSGSCHCGAVAFSVDADTPTEAISCNCSHCRRKGFLLAFFPAALFTLEKGAEHLATYRFHKETIAHQFCMTCGTEAFALGQQGDQPMQAINLRCVPDLDLGTLTVQEYDGASV